MRILGFAVAAMLIASAASAQELRELCADRPGLGTPPCVVDKGHVQLELGLGDWTRDTQPDMRTDTFVAGDLLIRYGVTPTTELRLNWRSYGHTRERDRMTGAITRMSGTGDVTLGVLQSLKNPDGNGLSIALLPEVSLPAGGEAIGAGTWGASLTVPASLEVTDIFTLEMQGQAEATPNESRHGRHFAYSGQIGLEAKISETVDIDADFQAQRDRDPGQHQTMLLAALSLDYKPNQRLQFDIQGNAGLNRNSPDVQVLFGVTRKF